MPDLDSLPPPYIVSENAYEAALAANIAAFVALWEEFRAAHPDLDVPEYDVATLEFDPAVIGLQTIAFGDYLLRRLLNDTARATLLARFARGADLDAHGLATITPASPEGLPRHPAESDDSYLTRILAARAGSSAAGPDEWWLTHVRAAHAGAAGASPIYHGLGRLTLAVTIAAGADPDEVLAAVRARLALGWVKPQGVTVTVEAAA